MFGLKKMGDIVRVDLTDEEMEGESPKSRETGVPGIASTQKDEDVDPTEMEMQVQEPTEVDLAAGPTNEGETRASGSRNESDLSLRVPIDAPEAASSKMTPPEPNVGYITGGSPVKRRRSGTVPPESKEVGSIAALSNLTTPQWVSLRAFLLSVPATKQGAELKKTAKSLAAESKTVITLLVADTTGCAQLGLWGEKAEVYHGPLLAALEEAPNGMFQNLQLDAVEVVSVKDSVAGLRMRKLQSTKATRIERLDVKALTMTPSRAMVISNFDSFGDTIQAPLHVHLHGVVDMVGAMKYSRDSVEMLEVRVTDPVSQVGIPLMLYGENATQKIEFQAEATFYYVDFKSPLPDREDEGGYGWCYDSALVLVSDSGPKAKETKCVKVIRVK